MAPEIDSDRADRLARQQALLTIAERGARRLVRDRRDANEILGYDADGLPSTKSQYGDPVDHAREVGQ